MSVRWDPPDRKLLSLRDTDIAFASDRLAAQSFERIGEGHYVLNVPALSTDLDVSHVQYERRGCYALLTVHTGLAGVQATRGILFHAAVNLTSIRERQTIAQALQARTGPARIELAQWAAVVDELAVRVYQAEQTGTPPVWLSDVVPLATEDWLYPYGFVLSRRHPAILFGDGDSLKTYTANAIAVALADQGLRVGIVDWEMTDEEHRARIARLDTRQMDRILYLSCVRPLLYERDRIAEVVHEHQLEYLIFDSVAFACHDKPESADAALTYFREVRSLGVGSLHLAHTSKGEQAQEKPFGSAFWHNSTRVSWFAKRAEAGTDPNVVEVGFYPKKFNLGRKQFPFGLRFVFDGTITRVQRFDVTESTDLAADLPLRERIRTLLKHGPLTAAQIAEELDEKELSVRRSIQRAKSVFVAFEGPGPTRYGLASTRRPLL